MIRGRAAPSKASASTTCQKCLKKDDYECQETLQERPYKARPSRTQQLFNPKLVPKLNSDVPNDLVRKKGVADEQLAKLEQERNRNKDRSLSSSPERSRKRARSSSSSGSSVSTVSTNRSRSITPDYPQPGTQDPDRMLFSQQQSQPPQPARLARKRRHSTSSGASSGGSHPRRRLSRDRQLDAENRNTRRRRSSISPESRGRTPRQDRNRRRRRGRSESDSRNRSQILKNRRSLTPVERYDAPIHSGSSYDRTARGDHEDGWSRQRDSGRYGGSRRSRNDQQTYERSRNEGSKEAQPRIIRERSLSPYSKRLALTQAMGR